MGYTLAKDISESYKGSEISFDKTTAAAIAKGFIAVNVQDALVEAKAVPATQVIAGIVRNATDAEVNNGTNVPAYARPDQIRVATAAYVVTYINTNVIPLIPPRVTLPTVTYGGLGSSDQMVATYASAPIGSIVVFDEYYTYVVGWGNGSSTVGAYRRRTLIRTNNSGWQFANYA